MTGRSPLTADARRLIVEYVHSIGALDLLLLVRAQPERWWTVAELCDALRCPPRWAGAILAELRDGGLLTAKADREVRYAFRPSGPRLARAADALADACASSRRDVVKFIFAQPATEADDVSDAR